MSLNHRTLGQQEIDLANALSLLLECDDQAIERFWAQTEDPSSISALPSDPLCTSGGSGERLLIPPSREQAWRGLSSWSRSSAKRIFDCASVVLAMPVVLPLMLLIGAIVRFTSRGPILSFRSE